MRKHYNKLVRDHIPTIIHRKGYTCDTITMTEPEYQQALREKLREEAQEAAETTDAQSLITELADLYEVLDALLESYGIPADTVRAEQQHRRIERGGFKQRIRLLWTE